MTSLENSTTMIGNNRDSTRESDQFASEANMQKTNGEEADALENEREVEEEIARLSAQFERFRG